MKQAMLFFFGSPKRVLCTGLGGLVAWALADPESVRDMLATGWNNFWIAFGPLFQQLIAIAIIGGIAYYMVKGLFKK